jgi:hypothetical protein
MKKFNLKYFLSVFAVLAMLLAAIPAMEVKADVASPEVNGNEVTFNYVSNASEVYLAGEMNGWDATATKMTLKDGVWTITLTLEDGSYQYKFVADGAWNQDPCNPNTHDDGFGGQNSVVVVGDGSSDSSSNNSSSTPSTPAKKSPVIEGDQVTFYFESATAKEVAVAGSMNNWSTTEDLMIKEGSTFSYTMWLDDGTYEYKFVVDGEWTVDPGNPETAGDYGNSVFKIGSGVSNTPSDDNTSDAPVSGGKYTYTIYGYSTDASRNTIQAAAIWIWDKTNSGEGQEVLFTETEELADGRTWVKAVVEFEASAQTGLILKSAGSWTWQTADLIYDNTSETAVTLYLVDGHDSVYTSLDDIVIDEPAEDTTTEEPSEETESTDEDKEVDKEKKPMNPVVVTWIVVAIVVIAVAVAAFFVVRKLTADLPASEEAEEVTEE